MKKYTFVLFILVFVFGLFIFNTNLVNATGPYNDYTPGCSSTEGYSPTTGEKCAIIVYSSLPQGCTSTTGYSPLTGAKCDSFVVNTTLPSGCTSTQGYSPTTGVKCDSLVNTSLPAGCTSTVGFSPTTGQSCSGTSLPVVIYPPGCTSYSGYSVTTGQSCSGTNSQSPVISGVSGPQTLNVNQTGTWTVTAYDSSNADLSYYVNWGDLVPTAQPNFLNAFGSNKQSATFTHSYSTAGTYTPTFTVTSNASGLSAKTSLSVNVGSTTVNPRITVIRPNGGETWTKGTTQTISWQDNTPIPACMTSNPQTCFPERPIYDIQLISYNPPCTLNPCPMNSTIAYPYPAPRTIAKGVYGPSFDWTIPNCTANSPCSSNFEIGEGSYTIQVCQSNTDICDSSNSYFKIVDPTSIQPLSITTPSLLIGAKVGVAYENYLSVEGSTGTYSWTITSGSLPVSFGSPDCHGNNCSSPKLYGTPTNPGTWTFGIQVTSGSQTVSKQFTFLVAPATCSTSGGFDLTTGWRCGCSGTFGYSSYDGQSCDVGSLSCPAGTTLVGTTNSVPPHPICQ